MSETGDARTVAGGADESVVSSASSISAVLAAVHDPPTIARHVGHLCLGLLLLCMFWDARGILRIPTVGSLSAPQPVSIGSNVAIGEAAPVNGSRYLQRAPVPLTARVVRDVIPFVEPRQAVRNSVIVYRVQPGDSVLGIAEKFGLKGTSLLYANDTLAANPDFLSVNQELYILPVDGAYHSVAQGETIETVAKKYKVEVSAITGYEGNGLEPPYTLTAGQKLVIPGGVKPTVPNTAYRSAGTTTSGGGTQTAPPPSGAQAGSGAFAWPMSGRLTQRYWEGHRAIDLAAPIGTPIVAADSGYVSVTQMSNTGYGRMIMIDHGNGYQTLYAHMSRFIVEPGQSVSRGEVIGYCGSTGRSTGPHVHFEIIKNGVRSNPLAYLP
ncbi:MAG TPA: peptidoglycan DD-metalloendopeptidase family protein [Chloroflexi bacterium]|nr:peptidoglycan DD-metalloendopeptidase family protein [Chloroflexota bacterium]